MTDSDARARLLDDTRRIIETGGDLDFAVRRLRYDGYTEEEIRSVVEPASSVVRWRTRLKGLVLLVLCAAFLYFVGHLVGYSTVGYASRGVARSMGALIAVAFGTGAALSMVVFGR